MAIPAINVQEAVPFPFDKNVVFVCVDIEAFEKNQNIITEVGIATLDPLDLVGVPPGLGGKNWFCKIRSRHFRIEEAKNHLNQQFVKGCPDKFHFGTSEFVKRADTSHRVASCFKEPFSRKLTEEEINASWADGDVSVRNENDATRSIIFVGHSPVNDIEYLRKIGYNVSNVRNLVEIVDTAGLYRCFRKENQTRSVSTILQDFELVGWDLHNAGNDAVYTLWIMIGIAVREAAGRGTTDQEKEDYAAKILANDLKAVEERQIEQKSEWEAQSKRAVGGDAEGSAAIKQFVDKSLKGKARRDF